MNLRPICSDSAPGRMTRWGRWEVFSRIMVSSEALRGLDLPVSSSRIKRVSSRSFKNWHERSKIKGAEASWEPIDLYYVTSNFRLIGMRMSCMLCRTIWFSYSLPVCPIGISTPLFSLTSGLEWVFSTCTLNVLRSIFYCALRSKKSSLQGVDLILDN